MLSTSTPTDHAMAPATDDSPPGAFRTRCRAASTTAVIGLWLAAYPSLPAAVAEFQPDADVWFEHGLGLLLTGLRASPGDAPSPP